LPNSFCCFKQTNSYLFGLPIRTQKVYNKSKYIIPSFDIHKSKLVVVEIQANNFGKTYTCFVFPTKLGNIFWENCFLKRNTTLEHKCIIKHLNHTLSTNYNGMLFSTIKKPRSCKKSFCCISSFLKKKITTKKCGNYVWWDIWPFLCMLFFNIFYYFIFNFFLMVFCNYKLICIYMFLQNKYTISFIINLIKPFLFLVLGLKIFTTLS